MLEILLFVFTTVLAVGYNLSNVAASSSYDMIPTIIQVCSTNALWPEEGKPSTLKVPQIIIQSAKGSKYVVTCTYRRSRNSSVCSPMTRKETRMISRKKT